MCGICGQINISRKSSVDRHQIEIMSSKLTHRGPDGSDYYSANGVGLAHKRLSILDVTKDASQPMVDLNSGVVITYNGEIYNYIEIRKQLLNKGYTFTSSGDTEVLLKAYIEWGQSVLDIINGMFAFVIFDPRSNEIFCARDPYGQKPFFYTNNNERFIFSSELTSLLAHTDVKKELNLAAVSEFLMYESFVNSRTPIKKIKKLPAGSALSFNRDRGNLKIWKYWSSRYNPTQNDTKKIPSKDDIEDLANILRDSVSRHLRSDVPLGIYLSGGIDSSLMTLLASDVLGGENIHTFTIGNPEKSFDESNIARKTSQILGTKHHELIITPEDSLDSISSLLNHMDEPLADPGLIAISQVAKFASNYVKVVISGDGGDELFCGYPPFHKWKLSNQLSNLPFSLIHNFLEPLVNKLPAQDKYMGLFHKAQIFTRGIGYPKEIRNSRWLASFLPNEIHELMSDGTELMFLSKDKLNKDIYKHVLDIHAEYSNLNEISKLSMEYQYSYLTNIICSHTDKANMQYSLEARSPYLDNVASQYINNLPNSWKLKNGTGKYILRRYLKQKLGSHVSNKKKQGFTVPLALWFKNELKEFCQDSLSEESISNSGIFNYKYVNQIYQNHLTGKENNYKKIWTILTFLNWQKKIKI